MALRPTRPPSRDQQLAERDAAQNDAFLREVDDALREDQVFGTLRRYGRPLGAALAAGLALLAGGLWWNAHRADEAALRGEQLTVALDQIGDRKADLARAQLAPLAHGSDGAAAAARLLAAGLMAQAGKQEAAAAFAAIADDSTVPGPYRDLAKVRQVAAGFDTMPPDAVIARLKPLAVPGNAWFASAGELVGLAYLKEGRKDLAGPLFVAVAKDKDAPQSARNRMRQLAGVYGFDALDDIAPAPAAAAPNPAPAGAPGN